MMGMGMALASVGQNRSEGPKKKRQQGFIHYIMPDTQFQKHTLKFKV